MNKFNNLYSSILKEEVSREDRIEALKTLAIPSSYRVLDISQCRGEIEINGEEQVEGTDIYAVAAEAKETYINNVLAADFGDDEGEEEVQAYVDEWVYGPYVNSKEDIAFINTGEESFLLIISSKSEFFYFEEDEFYDNWAEISNQIRWDEA